MQTFDIEHNRLFNELTATLKEDIVKIAGKCNGGKSILFVYPPRDEDAYVAKAREELTDGYSFIDVRESFRLFLDEAGIDTCLIREKVVTFRMVKLNMLLSIFLITK